ncbi:MAG: hypothetical protein AVDCRST_MAG11-3802, partial [uncultured Gemmatimonadaceae bacterium]
DAPTTGRDEPGRGGARAPRAAADVAAHARGAHRLLRELHVAGGERAGVALDLVAREDRRGARRHAGAVLQRGRGQRAGGGAP